MAGFSLAPTPAPPRAQQEHSITSHESSPRYNMDPAGVMPESLLLPAGRQDAASALTLAHPGYLHVGRKSSSFETTQR